jgi:hypothetical protein
MHASTSSWLRRNEPFLRPAWLLAALLVAAASPSAAQVFGPLPDGLVQASTLTDRERNFSIQTPGDAWSWQMSPTANGRVYACRRTGDELTFIVVVQDDGRTRMSTRAAERFASGVTGSLEQQGFHTVMLARADSNRLFDGSHRIHGRAVPRDGQSRQFVGYVGVKDKLYGLQALVPDEEGERTFETFAASFRLLEAVPTYPALSLVFVAVVLVLALVGWWLLFVRLRWSPAHQRVRWPLAILSPFGLALPAAYIWAVGQGTKSPDDLDRVLGQAAGVLMMVVLFAAVASAKQR